MRLPVSLLQANRVGGCVDKGFLRIRKFSCAARGAVTRATTLPFLTSALWLVEVISTRAYSLKWW